jgi:hypothetical protein
MIAVMIRDFLTDIMNRLVRLHTITAAKRRAVLMHAMRVFIDGSISAEGNTRDVCESATDA